MPRETLVDFFRDFALIPSRFLTYDDGYRPRSFTYRELTGAASAFAARLEAANIRAGDRVAFWSENRPEWLAAFWGCVLAGVVVVPVDYRSTPELLHRICDRVQAKAVLAGEEVIAQADHWRLSELDWRSLPFTPVAARGESLCEVMFTSGATTEPKGVTITHANILANIVPVENEILKHRQWSLPFAPIRFLNLLPLSHLFGQSMATFIPPMLPGEVIFMTGYNPREIVRQIHSRRVSVLVSVPKILEILREFVLHMVPEAGDAPPANANWLRRWWQYRRVHNLFGWKFWCFVVGAASLDPDLEAFWSKLGFLVVQGYGLTETAPIVTLNHPFHTSKGSVGKPIGGVEVRIADDGEIVVRGANVTAGYLDAGPATQDGWLHTGDIGSIDQEGRVFIRGRKKEMIVTPEGVNVFPEDVERVLNHLPGVVESAVVSQSDSAQERVHAVLVLEPGVEAGQVLEHANRKLEPHQQIRAFSLWREGTLPRTEGTQKLKRVALREWVAGRTSAPPSPGEDDEDLLRGYADETPLAQLGLSSLDRVELMVQSERRSNSAVGESAFAQAQTVGDLRRLARTPEPAVDVIRFPRWSLSFPARFLRRLSLPCFLLPLLQIFVRLRVSGAEHLRDVHFPVLFAMNHQSLLDVPTFLAALPAPWRYRTAAAMGMDWFQPYFHPQRFSRRERLGNSLQYVLACLFFNGFPLPQHATGAREALRYVGEMAGADWNILIFPEGVRTSAGEISPFRPGTAMMATRLKLPVVPVRIQGLDRVLHQSWTWPRRGVVHVTFGAAILVSGSDYGAFSKQIEEAVRNLNV